MGVHQKNEGLEIFEFLESFGQILGFYVQREEYMFPGLHTSPIFDMTWRRYAHEKSPLFIFEIESTPNKSTTDNAVKLFSRKTEIFIKPLFFFHIFVTKSMNTERIEYLKSMFDNVNYESYLLSRDSDHIKLILNILDLYFRFEQYLDLYGLLELINSKSALHISVEQLIGRLLQYDYDKLEESNFVSTLETFILHNDSENVQNIYFSYLSIYLKLENRPLQDYGYYYTPASYSAIIQIALFLITNGSENREFWFNRLYEIEKSYEPWNLWEPRFGLSQDHDNMLLYEFPILLTMLCLAFKGTRFADYFSIKLEDIISKYREINGYSINSAMWLLIASKISGVRFLFQKIRIKINDAGGIPINIVKKPLVAYSEDIPIDLMRMARLVKVCDFDNWNGFMAKYVKKSSIDLVKTIIGGFLIMSDTGVNRWIDCRERFAKYCLCETSV